MARITSFSSISQPPGLLGRLGHSVSSLLGGEPSPTNYPDSLLGSPGYSALGAMLQGAGVGLMTGDWGRGFEASNAAIDRAQRRRLLGYQMQQEAEDRAYNRSRDALADKRWQMQWDYNKGRQNKADARDAYTFEQQMEADQRAADQRQVTQDYVTGWMGDMGQKGAGLPMSPGVRAIGRAGGVDGPSATDMWHYNQAQPYAGAQQFDNAFQQITAQPPAMTPAQTRKFRRGDQEVTQEFDPSTGSWSDIATGSAFKNTPDVVNNIDTQGNTYEKERGKSLNAFMDDIEKGEKSAYDTLSSVQVMQNAMRDPSFYSGWGGNTVMQSKQFLAALGGDPTAAASAETFNAEAKRMALANMGGSLGTGFSNADRDFVDAQVANLGNTPQGNQALLEINGRIARRKIEIAQMARDYEIKNGRIDARFKQQLAKWSLDNPLFPEAADMPSQTTAPADPFGLRTPNGGQ